jgi:hypothetical protein
MAFFIVTPGKPQILHRHIGKKEDIATIKGVIRWLITDLIEKAKTSKFLL